MKTSQIIFDLLIEVRSFFLFKKFFNNLKVYSKRLLLRNGAWRGSMEHGQLNTSYSVAHIIHGGREYLFHKDIDQVKTITTYVNQARSKN